MNGSSVTAPPAAVAVARESCVVGADSGFVVAVDVAGGWVSGGSEGSVVTTLEPGCSIEDSGQI